MKIKYYLITGILALSLFLIINIPAALVIDTVKDKIPQVKFQQVTGTLWQGSAQQITVQSKHVFKNVEWSICVARILLAEACIEFDTNYNKNPLSAQLSVDLDQVIHGRNIKTNMSAQALGRMVAMPMGEISGDITVDLDTLTWQQGGIPAVTGVVEWRKASVTIAETAHLGDITIELNESEENPINANISNKNGQLTISGTASLASSTDYNADLVLTPSSKASKNLKNSLSLFASPQANGSFTLKNSGNLKQLGLM